MINTKIIAALTLFRSAVCLNSLRCLLLSQTSRPLYRTRKGRVRVSECVCELSMCVWGGGRGKCCCVSVWVGECICVWGDWDRVCVCAFVFPSIIFKINITSNVPKCVLLHLWLSSSLRAQEREQQAAVRRSWVPMLSERLSVLGAQCGGSVGWS